MSTAPEAADPAAEPGEIADQQPQPCGCGSASQANIVHQLSLRHHVTGQIVQQNLQLCNEHAGKPEDHVPSGYALIGKNTSRLR